MRLRAFLLLGLALVFGGIAAYMVNQIVSQQVGEPAIAPAPATETRTVVVAAEEISSGVTLTEELLRTVEMPVNAAPPNAFTSIESILADPPVVAVANLYQGDIILPPRLSTGMRYRGITGRIPEGYRAVAIPVSALRGVGGFVMPGDRVDVMHTTSIGRLDGEPVTRTLLQDITVLSIDQVHSEAHEEPRVASVASVLASPDQAKTLTLAQQVGQLTLALRNELDDEVEDPERLLTIALNDLWTLTLEERAAMEAAARARAEEEARRRNIGIIRGLEVREQEITVSNNNDSRRTGQSD